MQATFTPVWDPVPAKAFTPQQAFLSLKSITSGQLAVVAAKAGKDGAYTASLTPEAIATQIGTEVSCHCQAPALPAAHSKNTLTYFDISSVYCIRAACCLLWLWSSLHCDLPCQSMAQQKLRR